MKKKFMALLLIAVSLLASCADEKRIDGKIYQTYGLANEDTYKNDSIQYEVSPGSVLCAIIFSETIIVPVYIIGWDIWEPVGKLNMDPKLKGVKN